MYNSEVRHRAVLHYQLHLASLRKVAMIYNVGKSTLSRWLRTSLKETTRAPRKSSAKLHERIAAIVFNEIKQQPFQTADMLINHVRDKSYAVSRSTMYRTLAKLGHTYKRSARSRDHEPLPAEHPFLSKDSYSDNAIAVDESSFYWNDVPSMGWGEKGKRVKKARPSHRSRVSLILAVGTEGIIHYEIRVGGVKAIHFANFVSNLPDGRPLICDNCSIHKAPCVKEIYAAKNIELRLIPPYCPWYNPVEFCFSEIKRMYKPVRLISPATNFVDDVLATMSRLKWQKEYFKHAKDRCDVDRANGAFVSPKNEFGCGS